MGPVVDITTTVSLRGSCSYVAIWLRPHQARVAMGSVTSEPTSFGVRMPFLFFFFFSAWDLNVWLSCDIGKVQGGHVSSDLWRRLVPWWKPPTALLRLLMQVRTNLPLCANHSFYFIRAVISIGYCLPIKSFLINVGNATPSSLTGMVSVLH